jgi:HSP20 family protein
MNTKTLARMPESALAPRAWRMPFFDIEQQMADLWNRFNGEAPMLWQGQPAVDLVEKPQAFLIKMDLPGLKIEDIDIQAAGNTVTISGERQEEKEEKGASFHRLERRYGRFSRTVNLPCAVIEDECKARYESGVLHVTLPKCEEAKSRKIPIKA